MAYYKPSHLFLHCLQRYLFVSGGKRVQKKRVGHHNYGKCPKISYTKVSHKKMAYANSADPDQGAV